MITIPCRAVINGVTPSVVVTTSRPFFARCAQRASCSARQAAPAVREKKDRISVGFPVACYGESQKSLTP